MATSRKQIKFGVPFAVTVNNVREQELEVLNFHEREVVGLECEITNTTSLVPPTAYVTDKTTGIVKIVFSDKIPPNTGLELIIKARVVQQTIIEEKKVLIDGQAAKDGAAKAAAGTWKTIKTMFLGFVVASLVFWFIKGSAFGDFIIETWSKFNAAKVIQMADEIDPRVHFNQHPAYETVGFSDATTAYKRLFDAKGDLRSLYRFVGNDFFVTKDLIKDEGGQPFLATWGSAMDYCEEMAGARLLTSQELRAYLAGQYLTVENPVWPVSLRANIPEWSSTKRPGSWDDYWLYLKDAPEPAISSVAEQMGIKANELRFTEDKKFTSADDGAVLAAFRCGFPAKSFIGSE